MGRLFDNPWTIIILVLVIVLIFGFNKLPDAARSLGRSARILKSEVGEMKNDGKKSESTTSDASGATVAGEARETRRTTGERADGSWSPDSHASEYNAKHSDSRLSDPVREGDHASESADGSTTNR